MDKWEEKLQRQQERMARQQARWERHQEKWDRFHERWDQHHNHEHGPGHAVFVGGIIIAVGTLLLLSNLGLVRIADMWQYWPAILIAFGIGRIVDGRGFGSLIWGGAIAAIGGLILLQNLDLLRFDWNIIWPALLIGWGVMILLRSARWQTPWVGGPGSPGQNPTPGPGASGAQDTADSAGHGTTWTGGGTVVAQPFINLVSIFGGGRRQVDSQEFRGGEVTAIFGGYQIDLRHAAIPADKAAMIEATAIFGGIEIIVPRTWNVEARGAGVFGGFSDESRPPQPGEVTRQQRLIVTGAGVFGGVVVKN